MGKNDSRRRGTGSFSKDAPSRTKVKDGSSSSRHRSEREAVDIPPRKDKGKERATAVEQDVYYGAGTQFSQSPQNIIAEVDGEVEDDIELGNEAQLVGSYRSQTQPMGRATIDSTYSTSYGSQQYRHASPSMESSVQPTAELPNSLDSLRVSDPTAQDVQDQRQARGSIGMAPILSGVVFDRNPVPTQFMEDPISAGTTNIGGGHGRQNKKGGLRPVPLTNADNQERYQNKHKKALREEDQDLKIHHSKEFQEGRILKVYWFEPPGGGRSGRSGTVVSGINQRLYRNAAPGKWRRFVIVKTRRGKGTGGSSTAIPINTYGYRATTKNGCYPQDHAMIYTRPWAGRRGEEAEYPPYVPGEMELPNPRIKMDQASGDELLEPESRINYAKSYNIEHNYTVKFIGWIAPESRDAFWASLNRVNSGPDPYSPLPYSPAPVAPSSEGGGAVHLPSPACQGSFQAAAPTAPRSYQAYQTPNSFTASTSTAYDATGYAGQTQKVAVANYAQQPVISYATYRNQAQGQTQGDPNEVPYENTSIQPASRGHRYPRYYENQ